MTGLPTPQPWLELAMNSIYRMLANVLSSRAKALYLRSTMVV